MYGMEGILHATQPQKTLAGSIQRKHVKGFSAERGNVVLYEEARSGREVRQAGKQEDFGYVCGRWVQSEDGITSQISVEPFLVYSDHGQTDREGQGGVQ